MSATYDRFKRYVAESIRLRPAVQPLEARLQRGERLTAAESKLVKRHRRATLRYFGYVKKHPRLASRLNREMKAAHAAGNKNPVTRKGNLVIVSGPHSHAYPARKTRIGNKNPVDPFLYSDIAKALGWSMNDVRSMSLASLRELVRPVNPKLAEEISRVIQGGEHVATRHQKYRGNKNPKRRDRSGQYTHSSRFGRMCACGHPLASHSAAALAGGVRDCFDCEREDRADSQHKVKLVGNKNPKRRRNSGMGVSDLVMTPAYGAFGGAIQEGNYVGGPMHWMRRGIRNPKTKPPLPVGTPVRSSKSYERAIGHAKFGTVVGISDGGRFNIVLWMENEEPVAAVPEALEVDKRHRSKDDYRLATYLGNKNPRRRRNPATEVRELMLYIVNDGYLYGRMATYIIASLARKVNRGVYNHAKAVVAWKHLADEGAKRYAREHANGPDWNRIFSPADRKQVAVELADYYKEAVDLAAKEGSVKKRNPRYRQSPPGAPSLAASRASQWRSLGIAFPGAMKNPRQKSMYTRGYQWAKKEHAAGLTRDRIWHKAQTTPVAPPQPKTIPHAGLTQREEWLHGVLKYLHHIAKRNPRKKGRVGVGSYDRRFPNIPRRRNSLEGSLSHLADMESIHIAGEAGRRWRKEHRKKKHRRNGSDSMSFWKATIYSPTGKPIHRQVIRNTPAGAAASAKELARKHAKVALDGPYMKNPLAC